MILLLALALVSPFPPPQPLREWEGETLCWSNGYCTPRVVNLGAWDPIPNNYRPEPYKGPTEAAR